jgi:hypothetical protein
MRIRISESSHCAKNFPMHNTPGSLSPLRRLLDRISRRTASLAAVTALVSGLLAACGGGGTESTPLGDTGTLRVALTDAPSCGYDAVFVSVREVRVHKSPTAADGDTGWASITLPSPRRIDLLTLTNGALDELGQTPLEAGRYTQMRLLLADNTAATPLANAVRPSGQAEVALETPSALQSGLKMNVNIDVSADQIADVVIDFDACRSVIRAGASGRHLLKPVLSVTPRYLSGVRGRVDMTAVTGTVVTLQTAGNIVKSTVPDPATGAFRLSPVPPGTYDLVLTSPGRATAVVSGVTVTPDTLTEISSGALSTQACDCGVIRGQVIVQPAPVTLDAVVRVHQTLLPAGLTVEVASTAANAMTGNYSFSLPLGTPVVAAFTSSGAALSFTPAALSAGVYQVRAVFAGVTRGPTTVTVNDSTPVIVNFEFP